MILQLVLLTCLLKVRMNYIKKNYVKVIKSLMECVLFCGPQGLAFRGHRDDSQYHSGSGNIGNFLELVKFHAQTDSTLASHLKNAPRNATYLSKTFQNQLINVIGDYLRKDLITEIKKA